MARQDFPFSRVLHRSGLVAGIAIAIAACGSEPPGTSTSRGPVEEADQGHHPPPPPDRPTTKAQCDACGGVWAIHGLVPTESCICPTSDAGQPCVDGNQCIGQCLVTEDSEFQVMDDSVAPARGFYTGTCSTYDTTFGCHFVIPDGVEARLPLAQEEAALQLCID